MQVSAEVRWFWDSWAVENLQGWFMDANVHEGIPCGGGVRKRVDRYFSLHQEEVGLKVRDMTPGRESIEIKGLVVSRTVDAFEFEVQTWCKWPLAGLEISATGTPTDVQKLRWVRKFNTASSNPIEVPTGDDEFPLNKPRILKSGCTVEYTKLETDGRQWTSFGFEAFGDVNSVEHGLRKTVALMKARGLQLPGHAISLSYPAWLIHLRTHRPGH